MKQKWSWLASLALLLIGCGSANSVSEVNINEPPIKVEPFNVTLCEVSVLEPLPCRVMFEDDTFLIKKSTDLEGNSAVTLSNKVHMSSNTIPNCKLKGFNVIGPDALIICFLEQETDFAGYSFEQQEEYKYFKFNYENSEDITTGDLSFSGIDSELIKIRFSEKHSFCNESSCVAISPTSDKEVVTFLELNDGKILEVIETSTDEFAVYSKETNGYYISKFKSGGYESKHASKEGYNLKSNSSGQVSITEISTIKDKFSALIFDYKRFDSNSGLSWGELNNFGRTAWANYYYYVALAHILKSGQQATIHEPLLERLRGEIKYSMPEGLTAREWVRSKRYSYSNSYVNFQLHAARMLSYLVVLDEMLGVDVSKEKEKFLDFFVWGEFVEQFEESGYLTDPVYWGNSLVNSGWFYFRKGSDFWADGLPVPYNFMSAICTEIHTDSSLESHCEQAIQYLEAEVLYFSGEKWRYWPSELANNGYTSEQNVSINTPEWEGYGNLVAHDSYLSMDAIALLKRSTNPEVKDVLLSMVQSKKLNSDVAVFLDSERQKKACQYILLSDENYLHKDSYSAYTFYLEAMKAFYINTCSNTSNAKANS